MAKKQISMEIEEQELQKIDAGAKADNRSRSNFMVTASLERAEGIINAEQPE